MKKLIVSLLIAASLLLMVPAAASAAPSTITTSTTTILSTQRLVQYAAGLEWVFYYSSGYKYRTSADGVTWSGATVLSVTASGNFDAFTTYFDGTYLYFVTPNGTNTVAFRRATPVSDGTLTWSAVSQSVTITNTAKYLPCLDRRYVRLCLDRHRVEYYRQFC